MIIKNIFTNFLVEDVLDVDNDALLKVCYDMVKNKDKLSDTNQAWFMIQDNLYLNSEQQKVCEPLVDQLYDRLNQLHIMQGFSSEYRQELQNAWMNINHTHNTFQIHQHPDSFFSAVYYVAGDETCGDLEFVTPIHAHGHVINPTKHVSNFNAYNSSIWVVKPQAGKLVIFPSWLMHYVRPNYTNKDRISIAFNTGIVKN
jgi:uncharacterized protein (TIGR02466 family)